MSQIIRCPAPGAPRVRAIAGGVIPLLLLVAACSDGPVATPLADARFSNSAPNDRPPSPPSPPSPPGGQWDRVLADTLVVGDVVVPDGQRWLIGPNVQVRGNVRTHSGTIAMRPGSTLRLLGGDPARYVGGGMHYTPEMANDIGIWVGQGHGARGMLDIRCTPKVGWNRTGTDPSWSADDEYWIAPTDAGDYEPRRWYPGQPIPRIDPRVPAAEVMNVTRDCVIEGPGHILIHSTVPQRIEYVTLRRMGIVRPGEGDGNVGIGRYALHLHMMRGGSRGTMVRGVAAIESGGRVFVPHGSHGVSFIDNVSVNSLAGAFWWDHDRDSMAGPQDRSNDILVDRLAVSGVHLPREITGSTSRHNAVSLPGGNNLVIRNSAVSGARGSNLSTGYDWPSSGDNFGPAIWEFHDNVAHNNQGPGLRFWFNNRDRHFSHRFVTYRNASGGIETGAYSNNIQYANALLVEDFIQHHSSTKAGSPGPAQPVYYDRVTVEAPAGSPAVEFGRARLTADNVNLWRDCVLRPGAGAPAIRIGHRSQGNPLFLRFERCTQGSAPLRPDDVEVEVFTPELEGTRVEIINAGGTGWLIRIQGGQKIVTGI
jgi:hypothetical protein